MPGAARWRSSERVAPQASLPIGGRGDDSTGAPDKSCVSRIEGDRVPLPTIVVVTSAKRVSHSTGVVVY